VSAFARAQAMVVAITLGMLLLLVCGLPILAVLLSSVSGLAWTSPFYPFTYAFEAIYVRQPLKFWGTLFASHLVGWLFLVLASYALSSRWQDSGRVADSPNPGSISGHHSQRAEKKRRDLRGNLPFDFVVGWFMGETPVLRRIVWGLLAAWGLALLINWGNSNEAILTYVGTKGLAFILKALVAFQACRFFSESRSSGALELLLCTPVQNSDIIRAQWRKLRGIFLWPSITLILAAAILIFFAGRSGVSAPARWGALLGDPLFEPSFGKICWLAIGFTADILAVGWCGMCLALTLKKPILAPALTIIFVLILPSLFAWLDLVVDLLFISWATARLQEDFRQVLIQRYQRWESPSQRDAVSAPELAPAL